MTSSQCPFCGEVLNQSVKFCVNCQRAVSAEDAQKIGLKISRTIDPSRDEGFAEVSKLRKEYGANRQFRTFFLTLSGILSLALVYYVTMRFVLHEHLPYQADVLLERLLQDKSAP